MRIALLTPYTGDNLGDAAIQDAVIAGVRRRRLDAEIHLVSLSPAATTLMHAVPSFPLASAPYWSAPRTPSTAGTGVPPTSAGGRGVRGRLTRSVKRWPSLHSAVRVVQQAVHNGFGELFHVVHAYRFMRGMSLVIVSGGGQLDDYWGGPWRHPYALLKWGLIARLAGARYVFLSVGAGSLESRSSRLLVRQALRLAAYRSYRDHTSKQVLDPLGFTRDDPVYPDLAFSYVHRGLTPRGDRRPDGKVVGVSPIAYLSHGWPRTDLSVYDRYVESLVAFSAEVMRRGWSVVLFTTDSPDRRVVSAMVDALGREDGARNGRLGHPRTATVAELFAALAGVDCVVASRLHGVLLAHLLGLPVLAISYDRKVDTHMADMGLSEYCLDLHRFDTAALLKAFESLTSSAGRIRSALAETTARHARALERQYDAVLS